MDGNKPDKPKQKFQRGYIARGTLELWCFEELVRVKHFTNKYQRMDIMRTWLKDLTTGTHRGNYYFIISLDEDN